MYSSFVEFPLLYNGELGIEKVVVFPSWRVRYTVQLKNLFGLVSLDKDAQKAQLKWA